MHDQIRERYGVRIDGYFPEAQKVEEMVRARGLNCFYRSMELRKLCCDIRKVQPLWRALDGLDGWITGLRRSQAVTRGSLAKVELDRDHGGIVKLNPLADWKDQDVWDYIRRYNIPYNRLHDRGYPSIGCTPCTRAVHPGEGIRPADGGGRIRTPRNAASTLPTLLRRTRTRNPSFQNRVHSHGTHSET